MPDKLQTIYFGIREQEQVRPRIPILNSIIITSDDFKWEHNDSVLQKKYINIIRDILFSILDLSSYIIILDAYPYYRYTISELNKLAQFFQNRDCRFCIGKKYVSFTVGSGDDILDFAIDLHSFYHHIYFRFLKKENATEEVIKSTLTSPIGDDETKHLKKIKDYEGVMSFSMNYFFFGIYSCNLTFGEYLDTVERIVRGYGYDFEEY